MLFYYPDLEFFWAKRNTQNPHQLKELTIRRLRASAVMNSRTIELKSRLAVWAGVASALSLFAYTLAVVLIMIKLLARA